MFLSRALALALLILMPASIIHANGFRIEQGDLVQGRFQSLAETIRSSLEPGGENAALPGSQQAQILDGLSRIEQVLAETSGQRRSRSNDRTLRAEMERINTALASSGSTASEQAGSERICRRERVLGSNIPEMVCRTRAQIEAEREQGRDAIRSHERY